MCEAVDYASNVLNEANHADCRNKLCEALDYASYELNETNHANGRNKLCEALDFISRGLNEVTHGKRSEQMKCGKHTIMYYNNEQPMQLLNTRHSGQKQHFSRRL